MAAGSTFFSRTPAMLFLALLACGRNAMAVDIVAYAEESAPFHYAVNGRVEGSAADRLRTACDRAKLSCSLAILPWARAMVLAKQHPNTLLFSIVRSPEREKEFVWLSPITVEPIWIYGRPDSPPVRGVGDLAHTRVGVINGSSGAAFLREAGVPASAIDLANSTDGNLRKFIAHRVDFILTTEARMEQHQARSELPFKVQKVLRMQDATTYYAMNLKSDPVKVAALQAALQELKAGERAK